MKDIALIILVYILFIAGVIGIWVGFSYFEAKSFNRLTGSNVSTFDAMFLNLRHEK